jgi:hypothetical protein
MKLIKIVPLLAVIVCQFLIGCASEPTATDENARIQSQTRVTTDQIPAEGQRKIPVETQY